MAMYLFFLDFDFLNTPRAICLVPNTTILRGMMQQENRTDFSERA